MVTSSKKESEQCRDAAAQALGLRIILILLSLIGALFLGLFSKNKVVRVLSATCLLAIGIGVAVYYMNELPGNSTDGTPNGRYENMKYKQFAEELSTIINPSEITEIRYNGEKEFLIKILLFRDILRCAKVPDEALRDSYASRRFEELRNIPTRDLEKTLGGGYLCKELKENLNGCLSKVDMPEWKRHELTIRICLESFLPHSKRSQSRLGDAMTWRDSEKTLIIEANEILQILKSIGMKDGIFPNVSIDMPTSSSDYVDRIVREKKRSGIAEKWIREIGEWTIAWKMPANASERTPILLSPTFPYEDFLKSEKRNNNEAFVLDSPSLVVWRNGMIHLLHPNHTYYWYELDREMQSIGQAGGIVYLTPSGIIQPHDR